MIYMAITSEPYNSTNITDIMVYLIILYILHLCFQNNTYMYINNKFVLYLHRKFERTLCVYYNALKLFK